MVTGKSDLVVENENLFRTLVCAPIALIFVLFAGPFLMSPGLIFFKIIYVVMALYFTLSALAYGAYYTNEINEGSAQRLIKNENLFKALVFAPLAAFFCFIAKDSIMSSGHIVFNIVFVLMALYFTLSTLAYAAFYTNEYQAENEHTV